MDVREPDGIAGPASPGQGEMGPGEISPGEAARLMKDEKPLGSRAPRFVKSSRALHLGWQVGVFLLGLVVVVIGVIMLPLPGPGWLVIFAGMAIWGTEFVWAQLVLRWTKRKVTEAAQRALDPRVRRRNIILTSIGVAICAVLLSVYVWQFGLAMPWTISD